MEELIDPALRWSVSPEPLMADSAEKAAWATPEGQACINAEFVLWHTIEKNPPMPTKDHKGLHIDNKIINAMEKWVGTVHVYMQKYGNKIE